MKCHDCGYGEMKNYLDDERDDDIDLQGEPRLEPGEWRCEKCGWIRKPVTREP